MGVYIRLMSFSHGPHARWVGNSLAEFERDLADNLCYERGTTAVSASAQDTYWTLAVTVRDRLADRRARTAEAHYAANPKFVYYLSAEYMLGRQLSQNAVYSGTADLARQALAGIGWSAADMEALDVEPGLGTGGLGRLAACLLDSLATLDIPAVGYGIRYEFGIFKQVIEHGYQVEHPDDWTFYGNPWEFPAPDDRQVVGFYGHTKPVQGDPGGLRRRWVPGETVRGEPSHMLVPGYGILDEFLLREVRARCPGEDERIARMSLIQEGSERRVRMANLAAVGSFAVNGVAELQSRLLTQTTLRDFADLWPEKFRNETNGVSPRRFLLLANPRLAALITARLGDQGWLTDLDRLAGLEAFAGDEEFRAQWREVKRLNKLDLATHARAATGVIIDPGSLFDVMAKRLHEYKRQLLKLLHVITLYNRIKADPATAVTPRTVIFAAKAAPSYQQAKRIIKLINSVASVVNADPDVAGRIKIVFLPDYSVSVSELLMPAGNVSEQISLAGKEASGTGNMKLALNGAVTVGTLDGANIEIRDRVGPGNFFLFGLTADQATALRRRGYSPHGYYRSDGELKAAIDTLTSDAFTAGERGTVQPLIDSLLRRDEYMVLADYRPYIHCHDRAVEPAWADQDGWTRMSILNTARSGFFSSDRTVRDYCRDIWHAKPVPVAADAAAAQEPLTPGS